jgi:hypothetical protein
MDRAEILAALNADSVATQSVQGLRNLRVALTEKESGTIHYLCPTRGTLLFEPIGPSGGYRWRLLDAERTEVDRGGRLACAEQLQALLERIND